MSRINKFRANLAAVGGDADAIEAEVDRLGSSGGRADALVESLLALRVAVDPGRC